MRSKVGTDYYKDKGKTSLSLRVDSDAIIWVKTRAAEEDSSIYKYVEEILTSGNHPDEIDEDLSNKETWMTYVDSDLHLKLKVASIKRSVTLKDFAGKIIEEYYEKKTAIKKNATEENSVQEEANKEQEELSS